MELPLYDYFYSADVIRLAVILGVLLSALFYERVQLTSGGAIVPAFLAVSLPQPAMIVATLVAALITWFVVNRVLPRFFILYGRRKVEIEYLIGVFLVIVFSGIAGFGGAVLPQLAMFISVGMLIPGIVAHDMGRQGPVKTLLALAATTGLLWIAIYVTDAVTQILRVPDPPLVLMQVPRSAYPAAFLLPAVAISVLCSMWVFAKWRIRSGGFVTSAYLAFLATRPLDLVFIFVCAGITYAIVVWLLIPRMLLFGRRKLTTMMLVAAIVTWVAELVSIRVTGGSYLPAAGLTVITLLAPALLANDAQRQGWPSTLFGSLLGGVVVLGLIMMFRVALALLGLPSGL